MRTYPALDDVLDRARVVSIPTRTRFRGVVRREAVIFAGSQRASEFSPFIEYGDAEASAWLGAALEFGWSALPPLHTDSIAVNATIPAVSPDEVPGILARFAGCRTAKVKVAEAGQQLSEDVERIRAVRALMGADARIRVDANGGWSQAEATEALRALAEFDLDYAEQPCASVDDLAALRRVFAGAVRIAADESVRKAEDPVAVARAGAADVLVLKAAPLGGIVRSLRIVEEADLPVVVSSALDTSVGIAMGAHLAAALPPDRLDGACGLGTVALLAGDVTDHSLLPVDGAIPIRSVLPAAESLQRFAADQSRTDWWRARIRRCYELLA